MCLELLFNKRDTLGASTHEKYLLPSSIISPLLFDLFFSVMCKFRVPKKEKNENIERYKPEVYHDVHEAREEGQ